MVDDQYRRTGVCGFSDYEVDSEGAVYTLKGKTPRPLKIQINGNGYPIVFLRRDGKTHPIYVHRVVMESFSENIPDDMEVCHDDGNKKNCRFSNLRWDTRRNNMMDKIRHGTMLCGSKHYFAKINEADAARVKVLLKDGIQSPTKIANATGVPIHIVEGIKYRRDWKHVQV